MTACGFGKIALVERDRVYLRKSAVHAVDGVGVWIRLVRSGGRWVNISHHAVAGRNHRRGQRLLQLLLLLSVLGASVLEPNLRTHPRRIFI